MWKSFFVLISTKKDIGKIRRQTLQRLNALIALENKKWDGLALALRFSSSESFGKGTGGALVTNPPEGH